MAAGEIGNADVWKKNLARLSQEEIAKMLEREEEVFQLEHSMEDHLASTTLHLPDYMRPVLPAGAGVDEHTTPLDELLEQVKADVRLNGYISNTPEPHERALPITKDDYAADKTFKDYGIQVGILHRLLHAFVATFTDNTPKCQTPGCRNKQGKSEKWFCDQCSAERHRLAQEALRRITARQMLDPAKDDYGRERDKERSYDDYGRATS